MITPSSPANWKHKDTREKEISRKGLNKDQTMQKGKVRPMDRPYYTVQTPLLGKMKNQNFTFYSYVGGQLFGLISPTVVLHHYTHVQHPKRDFLKTFRNERKMKRKVKLL